MGHSRSVPSPSSQPAAPVLELEAFCHGIHGRSGWELQAFPLSTEATPRFMGAVNPCPISALIELFVL